jgi:phosphoglycerate dehydrogenase-like enzyme
MRDGYVRSMEPVVNVAPESDRAIEEAITAAGGRIGPLDEANALVWLQWDSNTFDIELPERVRWVQLPSAGVENWLDRASDGRLWTSAAGAYGLPVAEHALALMLAGARRLADCARATTWTEPPARPLDGSTVAIVGAGGIGRALIGLLEPLDVRVIAVTRRGRDGTLPADRLHEALPDAHHVVIAAPATPDTRHIVGAAELEAMREDAWLVNVARGSLVDTDALVRALARGSIAGAALDVTDPEPLPDGHPLWSEPRALITPHIANPAVTLRRYLARHVQENVARFANGEPLLSPIDPEAGY